jgi:hypothetical protein
VLGSRFVTLLLGLCEIARIFCFIVIYFLLPLVWGNSILDSLICFANARSKHLNIVIKEYKHLLLVVKMLSDFQEVGTLFLIGIGITIAAICNFLSVKCYNIIPIYLFVVFPSLSILVLVICFLILQLAQKENEKSELFLKIVKNKFVPKKMGA